MAEKDEEETNNEESQDFTGSSFFCFKIEPNLLTKGNFQIDSPYVNTLYHEIRRINDFTWNR